MLIIKRKVLAIMLIICVAIIAANTAIAYGMMMVPGQEQHNPSAAEIKFQAEKILFAGIIEVLAAGLIFILLTVRSKNISKELDKMIELSRLNPAATADGLLRLGDIGKKLNLLFRQLEEISEKRGLKISALSAAAEFLAQQINGSVIIIDVTGRVVQVSRGALGNSKKTRNEIVDRHLDIFSDSTQLKEVLSGLEKNHMPMETKIEGHKYKWVPLLNSRNEISYIAVIQ